MTISQNVFFYMTFNDVHMFKISIVVQYNFYVGNIINPMQKYTQKLSKTFFNLIFLLYLNWIKNTLFNVIINNGVNFFFLKLSVSVGKNVFLV